MEDDQKVLENFEIRMSGCPKHEWPKSWDHIEDPVVLLERNLYGHPLAGLLWERQFERALMELGWGKVPNWECLFCLLIGLCGRN